MPIDEVRCKHNSAVFDKSFIDFIDEGQTSCLSVVVCKNNTMIYDLAYGSSSPDPNFGVAINRETMFNVGSVSKPFTAAAIIKLVELGTISLQDPVSKYITEYHFKDITLWHLMTHTAGYDTAGYAADSTQDIEVPDELTDVQGFLRQIINIDQLQYTPGEDCRYYSLGYCLLMDIVERVSGLSFEQFVQQYIFAPTAMTSSTFDKHKLVEESIILPWDSNKHTFLVKEAKTAVIGDRGLFTTAADLVKFGSLFLNGGMHEGSSVFSQAAVNVMVNECTGGRFNKTPAFWARMNKDSFGCFGDLNSPYALSHTGFTGCMLLIDPQYDLTAAILTNSLLIHEDWTNYKRMCNLIMTME